jgi:hypothetical protein
MVVSHVVTPSFLQTDLCRLPVQESDQSDTRRPPVCFKARVPDLAVRCGLYLPLPCTVFEFLNQSLHVGIDSITGLG